MKKKFLFAYLLVFDRCLIVILPGLGHDLGHFALIDICVKEEEFSIGLSLEKVNSPITLAGFRLQRDRIRHVKGEDASGLTDFILVIFFLLVGVLTEEGLLPKADDG